MKTHVYSTSLLEEHICPMVLGKEESEIVLTAIFVFW